MMLVQKMMRAPEMLARLAVRAGIEGSIFAVSTLALLCLAIILHFFPGMLGRNVAEAAPLIGLAIMVPGLRNLVEYQAELLFGRGQMQLRALNLALLAGVKAVLLIWVLGRIADTLPGLGAAHLQRIAAAFEDHLRGLPERPHPVKSETSAAKQKDVRRAARPQSPQEHKKARRPGEGATSFGSWHGR